MYNKKSFSSRRIWTLSTPEPFFSFVWLQIFNKKVFMSCSIFFYIAITKQNVKAFQSIHNSYVCKVCSFWMKVYSLKHCFWSDCSNCFTTLQGKVSVKIPKHHSGDFNFFSFKDMIWNFEIFPLENSTAFNMCQDHNWLCSLTIQIVKGKCTQMFIETFFWIW